MRLDPKKVQYLPPFVRIGRGGGLRFIGRENKIQLTETALVFEGNLLKVGLLGLEMFFRRALAEWTAVTVPYSRIYRASQVTWPLPRIAMFISLIILSALMGYAYFFLDEEEKLAILNPALVTGVAILAFLSLYITVRLGGRFEVRFRGKDNRRRRVIFRIKGRKLRREFADRLASYRETAQGRPTNWEIAT